MAENIMVTRAQMEEYYSIEGRKRQMAGLRKLVTAFASQPGIICLHGGFPPAHTFPVKKMTLTLDDGRTVVIDDPAKVTITAKQRHGAPYEEPVAINAALHLCWQLR